MIRVLVRRARSSTSRSGNVTDTPVTGSTAVKWRRITRLIRPGLEVHGLGRADADQDTQDFRIGRPLRQRRVQAVATLFNGWKVESRRIRDRL